MSRGGIGVLQVGRSGVAELHERKADILVSMFVEL